MFLKIIYLFLAALGLICCTRVFSNCGVWGLPSCWGAWALGLMGSGVVVHGFGCLVAYGSSWTRDCTHVSWIGRWILNHCTTREVHKWFILFLIIIIFRWGSTDTSRVYFGGVLWENAECQDRTGEADLHRCLWWGPQMRGEIWGFYQVFQNWVLSLPEAVTCCRLWIFERLVWAKEKFTNLLLFPGYDKIRLIGSLGAQWIMHFLPKTKIRVSEKQHRVEV